MSLFHKIGDATLIKQKPVIIMHVCNNKGAFGGFAGALGTKYPIVYSEYMKLFENEQTPNLGLVQFVKVKDEAWVANMVAQTLENKPRNLNYEALYECLKQVRYNAMLVHATVKCPMIGSALAGGDWLIIEAMLRSVFGGSDNVNCTWYSLSQKQYIPPSILLEATKSVDRDCARIKY